MINMFNQGNDTSWKTNDELDFIMHIGTHAERNRKKPKIKFLKKYKEYCLRRSNWGDIHRKTILDFTSSLIKDEIVNDL